MIRKIDRFFVWLGWISFLALMFFDPLFQTSDHQNAEGTLIANEGGILTHNFLTAWQVFALYFLVVAIVTSLIVIWILGVTMWARRSKTKMGPNSD